MAGSLLTDLTDDLVVCVTRKGVIRAAPSLATGWDMLSKPPRAFGDAAPILKRDESGGRLEMTAARFTG